MRVRVVGLFAVLLAGVYLALPTMGSDLSAQVARADFLAAHGLSPVDLRWYGGVNQFGYSLVSPAVMALIGVRVTGALSLVGSALAFAALLFRTGVPRPLLGGLVGTVCIAGNLVSGRVTYALGVAFALGALVALTARPAWLRYGGAAAGAALAAATSPVAGLFTGLAGVALLLGKRRDGVLLAAGAAVPLAVTSLVFGEGGWMNISRTDAIHGVVTSLAVALLVGYRPVRAGALLSAAGVLAAALVHTPVGLNATRLVTMFALPVLAACARPPERFQAPRWLGRRWAAAGLVAVLTLGYWWQPPVVWADLRDAGNPTSDRDYFAPLLAELRTRRPAGRIEVPPTRDYWEAAYMDGFPLARGWMRQVDIARNPLFFETVPGASGTGVALTEPAYRAWLADNAVTYVAVPDAQLSWVGRAEADLVRSTLTEVWSNEHWRLYEVPAPVPLVAAPATLVRQDAASLTFDAPAAGSYEIRVRHSRWLTATGKARLAPDGPWLAVHVPGPGRYTLSS
ncbi:hypothetical protein [Phytohabitans aurantiacus]|uniref:MFS transporter n=1 Tax=Phytohabitans aurantiacus TaxID=3016789 RepID=A0ABQ5R8X1_9ACTN|nr:hypothetical protein Pa4123_83190 [Phytohabitans aurantiacus]